MEIKVSEEIKKACPQFAGIAIRATVENTAYSESLWKKIDEFTICYREMYTTDSIKDMGKTLAVIVLRGKRSAVESCVEFPCIR
jgi:hypothetical protein